MKRPAVGIALCLAIFHSPDGRELRIETQHIAVIRPADAVQEHVAPGTKTILYVGSQKMGVVEPPDQVQTIIQDCITNGEPQ
jgi:hypothetical protein